MISHLLESTLFWRLGWTLLHSLWQVALVGAVASLLLALLRRRSPQLRYLTACSALALMVLPLGFTFWLISPPALVVDNLPAAVELPAQSIARAEGVLPSDINTTGERSSRIPITSERFASSLVTLRDAMARAMTPYLPWIVAGWLAGAAALSTWNLGGWIAAQRLRYLTTSPATEELHARLRKIAERMRVSRPVRLLESLVVDTPVMIGCLRPVILLPASLHSCLTPLELDALLAHELAHVRRHDYLVNLLQTLAETLLFYHPVVWWISHRIRIEREYCCDDAAARQSGKLEYARALAAVLESRGVPRLAMAAQGRKPSAMVVRVRRVLGMPVSDGSSWLGGMVLLSLVAIVLLAAGGSFAGDEEPSREAAAQGQPAVKRSPPTGFSPVREITLTGPKTETFAGVQMEFARRDGVPSLRFEDLYAVRVDAEAWRSKTAQQMWQEYQDGRFAIDPDEIGSWVPLSGPLPIVIYLGGAGLVEVREVSDTESPRVTMAYKVLGFEPDMVDSHEVDKPPTRPLPRGLEFLAGVPQFREFRLGQTEAEVREIVEREGLKIEGSAERGFMITTSEGETLAVTMRDGHTAGIQRLSRNPGTTTDKESAALLPDDFSIVHEVELINDLDSAKSSFDLGRGRHAKVRRNDKESYGEADMMAVPGLTTSNARATIDMALVIVPEAAFDAPQPDAEAVAKVLRQPRTTGEVFGGKTTTYYFRTAENKIGVLQILPVKGHADRTLLRWRFVPRTALVWKWGEPVSGLQLGILPLHSNYVKLGESLEYELRLKNIGDTRREIVGEIRAMTPRGEAMARDMVSNFELARTVRVSLEPGETKAIYRLDAKLRPFEERNDRQALTEATLFLDPGVYRYQPAMVFYFAGAPEDKLELTTQPTKMTVIEPGELKETDAQSLADDEAARREAAAKRPAEQAAEKEGASRVVREIFRPTTRGSGRSSWSQAFAHKLPGGAKRRMMMAQAHRGDRWPVALPGETKPVAHVELVDGDDEVITLKTEHADQSQQLTLKRDQSAEVPAGDRTLRISYTTTEVQSPQPVFVDYATIMVEILDAKEAKQEAKQSADSDSQSGR